MIKGFVSGCFDWLAPGHVSLFKATRDHCDSLSILIADDDTVRYYKGICRPLLSYEQRVVLLEGCKYIDGIHRLRKLPNDTNQRDLIEKISPDIYFEGPDATDRDIGLILEDLGIVRMPLSHSYSALHIEDILSEYDANKYRLDRQVHSELFEIVGL